MYSMFTSGTVKGDGIEQKVAKAKFWEVAERIGAKMTTEEIDKCFRMIDRDGKGYFNFNDFSRVSKLVQGYEIDQICSHGEKVLATGKGKRCQGF